MRRLQRGAFKSLYRRLRVDGIFRSYRGAGLLLHQADSSSVRVLFGKRRFGPCSGSWSVPGGRGELSPGARRLESPLQTALRETAEEIGVCLHVDDGNLDLPKTRLIIPGVFTFITFILPYPREATAYPGHDFTRLEWFEVNALPKPLHIGVKNSVRKLDLGILPGRRARRLDGLYCQ